MRFFFCDIKLCLIVSTFHCLFMRFIHPWRCWCPLVFSQISQKLYKIVYLQNLPFMFNTFFDFIKKHSLISVWSFNLSRSFSAISILSFCIQVCQSISPCTFPQTMLMALHHALLFVPV